MQTDSVLDAREQTLYACKLEESEGLVRRSDRATQYLSIRYTNVSPRRVIESCVGSRGGGLSQLTCLYKAELIHRKAPWKTKAWGSWRPWNGYPGLTATGYSNLSVHPPR